LSDVDSLPKQSSGYKIVAARIRLPSADKYEDWLNEETKKKLDERLMFALNKDLHSPLTLAASISRAPGDKRDNIFKELLAHYKKLLWKYGPICCSDLSMEGVETSYNMDRFEPERPTASAVRSESAITWLCISESEKCIELPEVKDIIAAKWKNFGLPIFILDSILDGSITLLVTLLLIFINFAPTGHPKCGMDWFIDALYASTFAIFATILLTEWGVIAHNHLKYWRVRGTARFHILCRMIKVTSYFFFLGFQLADGTFTVQNRVDDTVASALENPLDNRAVKISLTVCVMTSWLHGYYYLL